MSNGHIDYEFCRPSPLLHPGHGHGLPREESQVQQMEGKITHALWRRLLKTPLFRCSGQSRVWLQHARPQGGAGGGLPLPLHHLRVHSSYLHYRLRRYTGDSINWKFFHVFWMSKLAKMRSCISYLTRDRTASICTFLFQIPLTIIFISFFWSVFLILFLSYGP